MVLADLGDAMSLNLFPEEPASSCTAPKETDDPITAGSKLHRLALLNERGGHRLRAAQYACDLCDRMGRQLDIAWFAWAAMLADRSGSPGLARLCSSRLLQKCLQYRRAFHAMDDPRFREELLAVLNGEIARLRGMAAREQGLAAAA
jgi:hypothetical protein